VAPSVQRCSLADVVPCSNAAKTRKPLKLAGVPQTPGPISAASAPKFILSGHVEEVLLFNNFFPIVDTSLSCEDIARQSCATVPRWRFFASCIFSEPRAARGSLKIQDLGCRSETCCRRRAACRFQTCIHPKFALRPHYMWKYGRHPICDG